MTLTWEEKTTIVDGLWVAILELPTENSPDIHPITHEHTLLYEYTMRAVALVVGDHGIDKDGPAPALQKFLQHWAAEIFFQTSRTKRRSLNAEFTVKKKKKQTDCRSSNHWWSRQDSCFSSFSKFPPAPLTLPSSGRLLSETQIVWLHPERVLLAVRGR